MEITIRKGSAADLEAMIQLLQDVKVSMKHQEWFYLDTPEEVRAMMAEGILEMWMAEDGEKLAGVFYLIMPGLRSFNYGYDLGFTQEELSQTVNMDTVAVRPEYRGQALHRKLLQAAEENLKGKGSWILLSTIHPDNCYSLNNAFKQGYEIQKEIPKYGSVRYLLRKNI